MRAEVPAGRRAPHDQYRYVMIEIALSTATQRRPFLPFLPLTVSQRRRYSLDDAAPTSCDRRRHAEPDPNADGARSLDLSTRQRAVRPSFPPLENRRSLASNPHRSQRRNRAPSGPRFRALALLGRLSWERVDAFVMQASEKPAQERTPDRVLDDFGRKAIAAIADFDHRGWYGYRSVTASLPPT
jgi:hypothetical protein